MKLMLISDIHGSSAWLDRAMAKVEEERPDQIIMLGDFCTTGQGIHCRRVTIRNGSRQRLTGISITSSPCAELRC